MPPANSSPQLPLAALLPHLPCALVEEGRAREPRGEAAGSDQRGMGGAWISPKEGREELAGKGRCPEGGARGRGDGRCSWEWREIGGGGEREQRQRRRDGS
ncbi:hypothetical protein PR202_gb25709 [Eleusine coracana subsp. coracana]|uniref:Uncharacterized protein n=1 Tax=Eleusine coracana subsp. coracana TaxID=191504 RepID=A0AAV5FPM8_ELECO|nr:hypothetical protein PR202_gb25709 [Eleusine coracana subsp. coracana]